MLGRQERVLEERIERIITGSVRWGFNWESDLWGSELLVVELRIELIFFMISADLGHILQIIHGLTHNIYTSYTYTYILITLCGRLIVSTFIDPPPTSRLH